MRHSKLNEKGIRKMKPALKTAVIATTLLTLAFGCVALATQPTKDPTKYDCRVVVGHRIVNTGTKPPLSVPIYECPHKDKMAAGECETSWLWGMRCKK
jgi:hypothetical protein